MSTQNDALRRRAVSASARATAQAERALRQLGADLHDRPGQHLALAALRLDALLPKSAQDGDHAVAVRHALRQAMTEIRASSSGRAGASGQVRGKRRNSGRDPGRGPVRLYLEALRLPLLAGIAIQHRASCRSAAHLGSSVARRRQADHHGKGRWVGVSPRPLTRAQTGWRAGVVGAVGPGRKPWGQS